MDPVTPDQESPQAGADAVAGLALDIAGSLDARTVMRRVLERGARMAAADRATLSSMSEQRLTIEASVGTAGQVTWIGREYDQNFLLRQPLVKRMLELSSTVLGGALDVGLAAPEFRAALAQVHHTALVPIVDEAGVVGMVVLSRFDDRPFAEADRPNLTALGAVAGLALRNAKLYERANDTARRLHAAIAAAAEVGTAHDLASMLQRIIEHAAESAAAEGVAVMRLEGDTSVMEATSGIAAVGSRWPLPAAVLNELGAGRTVSIDTRGLEAPAELQMFVERYDHGLAVPLMLHGDNVGVLVLGRPRGHPVFGSDDVEAVQQFASLAALLLSNARLLHQVREAERTKREFLDIAVHELQAPLSVIDGYASMLQDGSFEGRPDLARKGLTAIVAKAREARDLANGLLTLARLDSDELAARRERLPGRRLLEAAVERARPGVELASGSVDLECADDIQILGDGELIGRILDNLIHNAVNYTEGSVSLRLSAHEVGGCVEIRASDRGPGIPEADRERIFDRFVRGSGAQAASGSGLGLYVSRECARRMGGNLALESTAVGGGSVFLLTVPGP